MDMSFEIKASLGVDKATAYACLKLVERYVNSNNVDVIGYRNMDGNVEFHFSDESGDMVSLQDVIKAVDAHTDDEGKLDDDITCILEHIERKG